MMNKPNWDLIFRIIVVGDSGIGKTCLIDRYCNSVFNPLHEITVGVEFGSKIVKLNNGTTIKAQFWDTAGQETFRSITKSYYRNSAGIVLCYDITCRETFDHLERWLSEIKDICDKDSKIILIGTKGDLPARRAVTAKEGKQFAWNHDMLFYEVSSKDNTMVREMFNLLFTEIHTGYIRGTLKSGIKSTSGNYPLVSDGGYRQRCCS
jgi:Ras-related protein Rab-2A